MLGCRFMLKISRALCRAKDNNLPFGGINIIFAGDFAQLAPIREQRLFSFINTARVGTSYGQEIVFGKLLWLSVKTVVLLTQVMRQSGLENEQFVGLLSWLRTVQPNWSDAKWQNTPTIVSDNRVKDMINERSTAAFARRTGKPLYWYYASDTRGGKPVNDISLQSFLENMDSGQTNQRLG
ncbi:hypothetical protein C8J55DRAFT_418102 [Lentinula edodes]|uniref:ATP-dependent DNA helicase n=1 Tax=Lentinula lateritia TaxID=40482 RepID=A0A9W9AY66_9AGAR|nr:hypothetical protein C8J55DRAFT_418102 [Lentinula edodes]